VGLSFREYLVFTEQVTFEPVSLEDIRSMHRELSNAVLEKMQPLPAFNRYLKRREYVKGLAVPRLMIKK
jgi:hypothetical protein